MFSFKEFLTESEEEKDVNAIIKALPARHQKLLKGFKFKFQAGNTLKGDNGNVGEIYKNKITVASPWHYSRSWVMLHEIAHLVYQELMDPKLRKEWAELVKKTKGEVKKSVKDKAKDSLDQNAEEIFCMSYAAAYAKHPHVTFHHDDWLKFIKTRVP